MVTSSVNGKEQNDYDQEQNNHPAFKEEEVASKPSGIHEESLFSEILIMKEQGSFRGGNGKKIE